MDLGIASLTQVFLNTVSAVKSKKEEEKNRKYWECVTFCHLFNIILITTEFHQKREKAQKKSLKLIFREKAAKQQFYYTECPVINANYL